MTVLGSVFSTNFSAIRISVGTLVTLDVGADGYIGSMLDAAMQVQTADGFVLRNAGTISGYSFGLFLGASDAGVAMNLTNSGTIQSKFDNAIFCSAGSGTVFIQNSGTILTQSPDAAIFALGAFAEISNTGLIQGLTSDFRAFVASATTVTRMVNGGTIIGGIGLGDFADTLTNTGEITGDIDLGDLNDTLTNSGLIVGDILAGGGADMIDIRFGQTVGTVRGGAGNDTFQLGSAGGTIVELLDEGFDTVQTSASYTMPDNIEVLRLTGSLAIDGYGSAQNNTLVGNFADNLLSGRGGNDILLGNDGDDTLRGGTGDDVFFDGDGNDIFNGGVGLDAVNYGISTAAIVVNLATGIATGEDIGRDRISSIEAVSGGSGKDVITGAGADEGLKGGGGNDALNGGGEADTLTGGLGRDTLTGGNGADQFLCTDTGDSALNAPDRIMDFDTAADLIDLSQIDAKSSTGTDDDFVFVGSGPLSEAGTLRAVQITGKNLTRVEGDIDGDGAVDFRIDLVGLLTLTDASFAL